jgi:hypothetical protein
VSSFSERLDDRIYEDDEGLLNGNLATIFVAAVTIEEGRHGAPEVVVWVANDYIDLFPLRVGEFFSIWREDPRNAARKIFLRVTLKSVQQEKPLNSGLHAVTLSFDQPKTLFFVELASNARRRFLKICGRNHRRNRGDGGNKDDAEHAAA